MASSGAGSVRTQSTKEYWLPCRPAVQLGVRLRKNSLGEKKHEDFRGYDEDADSVAEFIRTFITRHNRWNSPFS